MELHEKIKHYRVINQMSQKNFANKLGITPVYLGTLERGKNKVSETMMLRLNHLDPENFPLEG